MYCSYNRRYILHFTKLNFMLQINDESTLMLLNSYFNNLKSNQIKNLINVLIHETNSGGNLNMLMSCIEEPAKVTYLYNDIIYEVNKSYIVSHDNVYFNSDILTYHREHNTLLNINGQDCISVKILSFLPFTTGYAVITDGKHLKTKIYVTSLKEITEDLISTAYTNESDYTNTESKHELNPF